MDKYKSAFLKAWSPIQNLYNQAFNANKYAAGIGLSVIITTVLLFKAIRPIILIFMSLNHNTQKCCNFDSLKKTLYETQILPLVFSLHYLLGL